MPANRHLRRQPRTLGSASLAVPTISRLTYRYEQYRRPADAVAGMQTCLGQGWRIVQIRGPVDGPFEVDYLREVNRDR